MKIAIVHYHLRRGGVTRVIETALDGFREAGIDAEIIVLAGEAPNPQSCLAECHRVVPGLNYRNTLDGSADIDALAKAMTSAASEALGGPPDLWHVHNHSLAKNVATPGVLDRLTDNGARLLLQIHDFAEDGRPENFLRQREADTIAGSTRYPDAPQIHYAVLNQRDAGFLATSGLDEERLHLLPNAIGTPPCNEAPPPAFVRSHQRFLLYPTRGIRRKNLGEMLLLAALSGDHCAFASTLAPDNPEWLAIHDRWKEFAGRHQLPVALGIGADPAVSFGGLIGSADALITTSVAEGFGLAFLEPWLAGKSIRGRDLPEITTDFSEKGIDLEGLYDRMDVPLDWIDVDAFREKLTTSLQRSYQAFDRELPPDAVDQSYHSAVRNDRIDFGRLDESLQESVLETLLSDPGNKDKITAPDLTAASEATTQTNAAAVSEAYGIPAYGHRLADIYQTILAVSPSPPASLDNDRLLDAFLDPSRFMLLRS